MNRILRIVLAALVSLFTVGGVTAVATPAQAYASCSSGLICFFNGYNGSSMIFNRDPQDRPGCLSVPANQTSSVDNNTSQPDHDIRVYTNSSTCSGLSTLIYANTEGNMAGQWDNSIDSMYLY